MELGNLCFGNSRGPIAFPDRDIVNNNTFEELLDLLDLDFYCAPKGNLLPKLVKTEYNSYAFIKNGKTIFEFMPYYWGDCTCGAEEQNCKNEEKLKKEIFSKKELEIYEAWEEYCEDDCPASDLEPDEDPEAIKICTCGAIKRNSKLSKKKESIKEKIDEFNKKISESFVEHKENCLLVKHNFIYHKGMDDEFWIDWYKYPFRDSYMNKELTKKEIIAIFRDCIKEIKSV